VRSRFLQQRMAAWIRRRQGADRFPLRLVRRRLYILPTRAGLCFGIIVFLMLVAGLNYANSLALLLAFSLAGFALVAMYQCHRNLLELALTDALALPAFAGERAAVQLALANDTRVARYRVTLAEAQLNGSSSTGAAHRAATSDLGANATGRLELSVPAQHRGVVRIERLRIESAHPFGLFRAWTWVHAPLALVVYPAPRGARPMPAHPAVQFGETHRGAGDGDEWLGLRAFRPGDSPRQVAWKAYARGAPLLVKEYAASASRLRLFDFADLHELPVEARLEQLSRWIVDAEARGERYGLQLPGEQIEADHGPAHRHRTLMALALYGGATLEHG